MVNDKKIAVGKLGMNRDSHESTLKEQEYTFARNANLLDESGNGMPMLQNEHSNILCSRFPDGFKVVGFKKDENADRTYFFLANPETKHSEIGYISNTNNINIATDLEKECNCNIENILSEPLETQTQVATCVYTPLIRDCEDKCLKFDVCNPIKDIVLKEEKCGKALYWTDFVNPPRAMYLDDLDQYKYIGYANCGEEPTINPCLVDCDKLRIFKKFSKPCLKPEVIQEGGNLRAGVYEFLIAYCDKLGNELSQYYSITNPIPIADENRKFLSQTTLDYQTTKSIRLTVSGLDNRVFSYYKIAVIQNADATGATDYLIEGIHTTDDTSVVYSNDRDTQRTTIQNLLAIKPYYDKAEMLTTSNGMLFMGGLVGSKHLNLQPVVNLMGSFFRWYTVKSTEGLYKDGVSNALYKSTLRDEVYPYGIRFDRKNGQKTTVYPLINRPPSSVDLQLVDENTNTDIKSVLSNVPNCSVNGRKHRWQYYNTASKIIAGEEFNEFSAVRAQEEAQFSPLDRLELACKPTPFEFGKFGYYESEDEYPDNAQFDSRQVKIKEEDLPTKIRTEFEEYFVNNKQNGEYELKEEVNFRCKPIRHYRTPDNCVSPFMGTDSTPTFFEDSFIYPLGAKIDKDVVISFLDVAVKNNLITQEEREDIIGYEIVIGDRTANASVVAKGLLYDMYKYKEVFTSQDGSDTDVWYSNYPFNDLGNDDLHYTNENRNTPIPHPYSGDANTKYTFHSPDTHFNYPTLPPELKIEGYQYGQSKGCYAPIENHPKWVILGKDAYKMAEVFATLEIVFELLAKYGDYENTQAMSADRYIQGGNWGKTKQKTDLEQKGSYSNVSGSFTLGTGSINTSPGDGSTKGEESSNWVNHGDSRPLKDKTADIDDDGSTDKEVEDGRDGLNYEHYDNNTNPFTNTKKWLLLANLFIQQLGEFGKKRYEWLKLIRDNGKLHNFAYMYSSVAKYNGFECLSQEGELLRGLPSRKYLSPHRESIVTATSKNNVEINNLDRESSVYLSVGDDEFKINYNSSFKTIDNSRLSSYGEVRKDTNVPVEGESSSQTEPRLLEGRSQEFKRDVASMYGTLRNWIPNQYGTVHSVKWLTTNTCTILDSDEPFTRVFGGDTVITRFSLRRKLRHFTVDALQLPDRLPYAYYSYKNIGHPKYYVDYEQSEMTNAIPVGLSGIPIIGSFIEALIGTLVAPAPDIRSYYTLDTVKYGEGGEFAGGLLNLAFKKMYVIPPSRFYLQTLGIPTFLCESSINQEFRYAELEPHKNFYPNAGDYSDWQQPYNLNKKQDNTYYYRDLYSKRVTNTGYEVLPVTYDKAKFDCLFDAPNGVIWSEQDNSEQGLTDPFLNYKPLNKANLATSNGKLIDIKGIESQIILARFDNTFELHNTIDVLRERITDATAVLGTGGIFSQRPLQFSQTDTGYHGTQHKAIVSTPYGHFWCDAKRGHVFVIEPNAKGFDDISNGLKQWFKEHLPFKLLKSRVTGLDDLHVDNPYVGYGIVMGYDERFERVFLTKLDYKPKFETCFDGCNFYKAEGYETVIANRVQQGYEYKGIENCKLKFTNNNGTVFDLLTKIDLTDENYFEDASFTVAYSPITKTWISYYDFKPQFFIPYHNYFKTGLNYSKDSKEIGLWSHLLTNKSYQVYYGKKYPFEVEVPTTSDYVNKVYQSTEYWLDARRYQNEYDFAENREVGFNKAIIYNHSQNSGELILKKTEKRNPLDLLNIIKRVPNQTTSDVAVTMHDKRWTFNYAFNRVRNELNNIPIWKYDINQIVKKVQTKALDYNKLFMDRLRGDWFLTRFTQDKESRFKIIFKWKITNQQKDA